MGNCGLTDDNFPEEILQLADHLETLILASEWYESHLENGRWELKKSQNYGKKNHPKKIPVSLQSLYKLQHLVLWYTTITDLIPFKGLTSLQSLNLWHTNITDLRPLKGLTNLYTLDLGRTLVVDLTPLQYLNNLQWLNLSGTDIFDLTPIQDLPDLHTLLLYGTQVIDLTPIQCLTSLRSLNLSGTNISDLKPLQGLTNLQKLGLGGTDIVDLDPLQDLTNLHVLGLHGTEIADLTPLQGLINLHTLDLGGTDVADLGALHWLSNLQLLDLSVTDIVNLNPLQRLENLQWLDLSETQITEIPDWLIELPRLNELQLHGCQVPHLPYEIIQQDDCYQDLKNWFNDLKQGWVLNEEIKIILIGNGRVGKSCIMDRLTGKPYTKGKSSTHAIQLATHETKLQDNQGVSKDLILNYWDFGGQDIYHGTHRIFMQSRAIFLLIWDWEGENNRERAAEEDAADGYIHRNHIVPHWLDYIKSLSKESPVIVVQNKIDQDNVGSRALKNQEEFRNRYKVEDFRHVSAEDGDGIADLQRRIGKVIQKMPEWQLKMPASWHKARELVRERTQSYTDISQEEFKAICAEAKVREVSRSSLLRYLHDTGILYFNEEQFHGRIILDQQWVIEAIYSLFDRRELFWEFLKDDGRFTFRKLHRYWKKEKGFEEEDSKLALSFMLSAEICYQLNNPNREEEPIYVAPQLLPLEQPISIHPPKHVGLLFRYEYSYLHQVFIHRLIVRAGKLAQVDHVWQNGIQFYWGGTFVIVEAVQDQKGPGGYIQIQVSGDREYELLERLRNEFGNIHPKGMQYRNIVSLDGDIWVDRKKLGDARKDKENVSSILCEAGKGVNPEAYKAFFGEQKVEEGIKDLKPETLAPITPQLIHNWKDQILDGDLKEVISMLRPSESVVFHGKNHKIFVLICIGP
ncbi:MAG: COR domain-containing protein, partial [Bacteroidota bacterium]